MKNRLLIYSIISLAILIVILLVIDILTGILFWNRYNLIFEPNNFNNILTPILTIISTAIYATALFITIKQNKIILSQNIKPHYEREIEAYIAEADNIKIINNSIHKDQDITAKNYIKYINESIFSLAKNEEFHEDYDKYNSNEKITVNHVMKRDYIYDLMFLTEFTMLSKVSFFYDKLKEIIEEINKSKLIEEDKQLLKKRIERSLLSEYLAFIDFEDKHINLIPPIPLLYQDIGKSEVEFGQISKTGFRKNYEYFKKEFNR